MRAETKTGRHALNKLYEGLFLMDSNLAAKDWPGLEGHVHEILKKHGAELLHTEKWPDRRLAYEIKGCKKGTYYLTYFNAPSTSIDGMRSDIALSERIIRVMFVSERGLEEEMERRKNKEIGAPPADFFDDRGGYTLRARSRRDAPRDQPNESPNAKSGPELSDTATVDAQKPAAKDEANSE